eukprot:scaffold102511_cov15-Tisochrysis_lutea.AAC.1
MEIALKLLTLETWKLAGKGISHNIERIRACVIGMQHLAYENMFNVGLNSHLVFARFYTWHSKLVYA